MHYILLLLEIILYMVFIFLSSFILILGKTGTGIKKDYVFTALLLLAGLLVL